MTQTTGKERILDVALELFCERGFHAVSIRDIGHHAGLTNPALYRHFKSKRDLGVALFATCYDDLLRRFDQACLSASNSLHCLLAYVDRVICGIEDDPRKLLYVERLQGVFWKDFAPGLTRPPLTNAIAELVRRGQTDGDIRAQIDPAVVTTMILALPGQWAEMVHHKLVHTDNARDQFRQLIEAALGIH